MRRKRYESANEGRDKEKVGCEPGGQEGSGGGQRSDHSMTDS